MGAPVDGAWAPLPIGRHLRGRGCPGLGHLASPLLREIGGCRALASEGKGIGREGPGPRLSSLWPALPCPPPRHRRRSDALCSGHSDQKLCPEKSPPARPFQEVPGRSFAPRGPARDCWDSWHQASAVPRRARAAARMRYADPSANRDLLGSRTLLFIFICAFALVTLLQQILYGRNYIKR